MRQLMALIVGLAAVVALTTVAVAAPVGEIRLTVYCSETPERTIITNFTNEPLNLYGWQLGSMYSPISGEPASLIGVIPSGGSVTYQSGPGASGNILHGSLIYDESQPSEGARLTTIFGILETRCSQGTNSLAVTGGTPPAPSPLERPVFENLTSEPWSTVQPGAVRLAVTAYADSEIKTFSLKLNGEELNPEIGGPTEYLQSAFTERTLSAGVYTLTSVAIDEEGHEFRAQWNFVVATNAAETEWFNENGQPKAAQLNATIRSLVEAFRWHLFGLSWDGQNHTDLPTHVAFQGQAPPLETWVTGTTFNRPATEATLRSLVEAFRWHFWGISWDNAPHCDIPTHIPNCNQFQGPQSISPWFTSGGQPIQENIEATLRSLVESFRWHFWGYSWDGEHHFEIPTHGY